MSSQPFVPVPGGAAAPKYPWQEFLDVVDAEAPPYIQHFNPNIVPAMSRPPKVLLDVGCSSGNLGAHVKATFPDCRTIGIEPNRATADLAAPRLDQVLCGRFEELDLEGAGIHKGSIDTVVMADVLEHMYNPWRVMVDIKPYLTADAQMILSIPNTRHLGLMRDLVDNGIWPYVERGLLDITHIRFFTLKEILRFLQETGYAVERVNHIMDPQLADFYSAQQHNPEINIRAGRFCLERVTPKELAELCTWQFLVRARPL